MKISLKNIADETGYSISTVSRFLCGKRRHYNEKEKLIFKTANKYNYPFIQNFYNNGINLKVSLIMNIHKGEFFSSLLSDFHIAAKDSNCDIEIIDINKKDFLENKLDLLIKNKDGLCILYPDLTKDECIKLETYTDKIPILSLSPILESSINTITFDNYLGGYLAAKHLKDSGYKNVGIISGNDNLYEAYQRRNGFMDFLTSNNMECKWEFKGNYSLECGYDAFEDFNKKNIKDIGIFGVNDNMCFGFMKLALLSGIKIPENISIIGFDNTPFCENSIPELTSISTDFIDLGQKALAAIEKSFIDNHSTLGHSTNLLPVNLINRASTKNIIK